MIRDLVIASAGAGKTQQIIDESCKITKQGKKVLVITYTRNNQSELKDRFLKSEGLNENFIVKGLFSFLLEDIIRPYQQCFFKKRIESINFNDSDPHKQNGRNIKGRKESDDLGVINPRYYLTACETKAHTTYLSKLSERIMSKNKNEVISRMESIYSHVYFDEVQDLVGWDYDVINGLKLSKKMSITCVGDFRQTIYDTSVCAKQPKTNIQKLESFRKMKFELKDISYSKRSIQPICDYADLVHAGEGFTKTESKVTDIPADISTHIGVFAVRKSDAEKYLATYKPVMLRVSNVSGKEYDHFDLTRFTFGKSKGLTFDRTVIIPTKNYLSFLLGTRDIFNKDKTDAPKNKLYVAITRAKYSVAFIIPDAKVDDCTLDIWVSD